MRVAEASGGGGQPEEEQDQGENSLLWDVIMTYLWDMSLSSGLILEAFYS